MEDDGVQMELDQTEREQAVLTEAVLEKFGGDSVSETRRNAQAYIAGLVVS